MKKINTTVAPIRRLVDFLQTLIRKNRSVFIFRKGHVSIVSYVSTFIFNAIPKTSYAATGMPWDTPLSVILTSLQSDFLKFCTIASIIIFGVILAFSEDNGIFRRAIKIIFGLSIACSAASFGLSFFGFSG